jgi:HD-like signal output (HDOD) protein
MLKLLKRNNPRKQLKKVLGDYVLPTFPAIAQQVMERIRDPNVSNAAISDLVSKDPGLSAGVLKTVNSAAFSPVEHIDSMTQAVAMLGLSPLESLVLSISVGKLLPAASSPYYSQKAFWLASARRAAVARAIAAALHPASLNLSYTAALLQDLAIPFLVEKRGDAYGKVLEAWYDGVGELAELEREAFEWDHAEVATWLCREWKLPASLCAAIGGHHGAMTDGFDTPPAVILVGYIRNTPDHPGTEKLIEIAQIRYSMNPDRLTELVHAGFETADELATLFTDRR